MAHQTCNLAASATLLLANDFMKHCSHIIRYFTFAFAFLVGSQLLYGQPVNDDCVSARHISDIDDYCSEVGAFTIRGATESPQTPAPCFPSSTTDVWFTFFALTPGVVIQVNGNVGTNPGGDLNQPSMALLQGSCSGGFTEIACGSDAVSNHVVERVVTDLLIGELYYIRVDARNGNLGTFQLCVDAFVPTNEPSSDCPTAVVLCDKSPFVVQELQGSGIIDNEADGSCLDGQFGSESSSVWYKWTCDVSGSLEFTLTPNAIDITEDLDFAVYELPNGLNDCSGKILLRCMASGENVGQPFSQWQICTGPTGMRSGEGDTEEQPGCQPGNNNFISPINMESGKSYALIVNNFTQSGRGFEIEFGGTGTFLGPTADFDVDAVQAFECDKTIIFTDLSGSETDSIVSLTWNFGAGANPGMVTGSGPHDVIYASFGDKRAALTVETERGCRITKILDFFVEPCCADTSTLMVDALVQDLVCPDIPTGVIEAIGISGAPFYLYSLDGVNYQPSPVFPQLIDGPYQLFIQDSKGCENEVTVEVMDAPIFTVDAGDTIFVDLGELAQLNAVPSPFNVSTILWDPLQSLIFEGDSLMPIACAPGTTTYNIQVTNSAGCMASDDVVVAVNIIRPVYIPNVISANRDAINDYFYVQTGPAAAEIEVLRIFDRWGGMLFERLPMPMNSEFDGWDGTVNGEFVNPGVYTYYAKVRFKDNQIMTYSGTVTVLR